MSLLRVPTDREGLVTLLHEAAELEHGLMLQYLYAAFALPTRPQAGVSELDAERCRAWKRTILEVAREEMVHLALVCQLCAAIGERAWFMRPSFPADSRYYAHPHDDGRIYHLRFSLEPLSPETIARFVRFEQPETEPDRHFIAPPRYLTVGVLYRTVRAAIDELDDGRLFEHPQPAVKWSNFITVPGIADRATAHEAIDRIIAEGEAAPVESARSHWARFRAIASALDAAAPVRPVLSNPSIRPAPGRSHVTDPSARAAVELFDRTYTSMIALLELVHRPGADGRLRELTRRSMSAILRPLGEVLTALPSGVPGRTAGPAFDFDADLPAPDVPALGERYRADAVTARALAAPGGPLATVPGIADSLQLMADRLGA